MFERFTNRARHAVVLAQEEARLLNHNYIGTEHVLLGLLGEPEEIAGTVLASFGITRDGTRVEVEEIIGMGKAQPASHIPFTPRAKKTLELSLREALQLKHNYIGTEHILLGLIRESDGVAVQIMRKHAELPEIRAAVLDAMPDMPPVEAAEGTEETNAVLRWLRQRLTGRNAPAAPPRPYVLEAGAALHGTPAVEAALKQATALAGHAPVGSHHLLLAALADTNSAATWALAQLGVDIDELRAKLRAAEVTGTSDEQPEQAGRRQMSIQVTDEILTLVLTDPVIVEAAREAIRAVNARAASATATAAAARSTAEGAAAAEAAPGTEGAASQEASGEESPAEAAAAEGGEAAGRPATATLIRGDLPEAAGLADVWLELRQALNTIADPKAPARRVTRARRLAGSPKLIASIRERERAEGNERGEENEPGEGEAASS
jgi:ATP-dependent Clp protease ATP-binding subunit ClpA